MVISFRVVCATALVLGVALGWPLSDGPHAQSGQGATPQQPRRLELPSIDPAGTVDQISPQPWTSGRYRLTPGDVIELRFPVVPEFDQTVTVQPDGFVSLRSLGDLRVQGRSLPELRAQLVEAYAGILREPRIDIILRDFEKPYFIVAGEVARPGKYELRGATSLTQALVLAGGGTGAAKHSQVVLFRRFSTDLLEVKEIDVKQMYESRNLSEDPLLRPGDTIFVPKRMLSNLTRFLPTVGIGLYLNPLAR